MRIEFALIAAILIFCCWCAYILFSINSNVSTASFPTIKTLGSSSSTSPYPSSLRSLAQDDQTHGRRYPQSTRAEQQRQHHQYQLQLQHQQQQASSNRPSRESVFDSQDKAGNRASLARYFRHPEARENDFTPPTNNFVPSNHSNVYHKAARDYYSSFPASLVGHYRQPQQASVGMVHKVVDDSLGVHSKEADPVVNLDLHSDPDLNSKSEPDSESESETETETESVIDNGQDSGGEVEPDSGGRHGTDVDEAKQEQQPASEEQILRRSWSQNQSETKTGLSKANGKTREKVNQLPPTWNKQSKGEDTRIINNRRVVLPGGRGAGLITNKNLLNANDQLGRERGTNNTQRSRDEKDYKGNNIIEFEHGTNKSNVNQRGSIKAIGKLLANVTDKNGVIVELYERKQNLTDRKPVNGRLRHPVRHQVSISTVNKSPNKSESHKHRVKESLSSQHWDDDASSPPEKRTQKPESKAELESNEAEAESEEPQESSFDEDQDGDPSSAREQNEEDGKEEMELEAETGPQQVAPETGELDLVGDPDQFMHSSDRRKRDIFTTSNNNDTTTSLIHKVSESEKTPLNMSSHYIEDNHQLECTDQEDAESDSKPVRSFNRTEYTMLDDGMPTQVSKRWNNRASDEPKNVSLLHEAPQYNINQAELERKFDVLNENLIGPPNKGYLPADQPVFEPLPTAIVYDNDHAVGPISDIPPYILDSYTFKQPASNESKSKEKKVLSKKKKKKKKTKSELVKSKSKAAELMRMKKKKSKSSKGKFDILIDDHLFRC